MEIGLLFQQEECSKMELLKLRTGGFKNIEDTTLELSDLTALVSLNSYGKSNLLTAIDFGIDFISADPKHKEQMMRFQPGIPLNRNNALQNFFFELEAKTILAGQSYLFSYRYEFQWRAKGKVSARIVSEQLEIKKNEKNQRYGNLIFRDDKTAFYKSSPTGRCTTKTAIEGNDLVLNKLIAFDQLYFLDLLKQLNSLTIYVDHHLDASMSYGPDFLIRTDLDELDLVGIRNIPRTIFYLKQGYPEKYELLKDAYLQLFPNFTDFDLVEMGTINEMKVKVKITSIKDDDDSSDDFPDFDVCDKFYDIKVDDDTLIQPISFEKLSDGAKRMLLMLTFAVIADIKGLPLIAFEEPENSLHPSLMQSFLLAITQLTENCKIIITSHSPYMLQYILTNNIYIGMPNKKHLATFRRILNSRVSALLRDVSEVGLSVGEYIFELMSDHENDIDQLNDYLEQRHG
ncbi:MAG: ATP-binding protein [Oscillospiraceae bacterium]|jgi:predicted ATPase|nr:ATP-binding protein [Oscillospiraceae bacterium]